MSHSCTVSQLQAALASSTAPQLLDVRRAPVFQQADEFIAGAAWRDPEQIAAWSGESRQRAAGRRLLRPRASGQPRLQRLNWIDAAYLEGGIEAWKAAGGPMADKSGASV